MIISVCIVCLLCCLYFVSEGRAEEAAQQKDVWAFLLLWPWYNWIDDVKEFLFFFFLFFFFWLSGQGLKMSCVSFRQTPAMCLPCNHCEMSFLLILALRATPFSASIGLFLHICVLLTPWLQTSVREATGRNATPDVTSVSSYYMLMNSGYFIQQMNSWYIIV